MKLKLHENIKRLRRERNLTQEKLAEILGVTVGAVSKWENGNNTPDIVMLATIASFFDVSIDVLLGYDMASKKAAKLVESIDSLVCEHRFDEAENLSKDAISRYPHDFSVIYASAKLYCVKALENMDKEDARKAMGLLTRSMDYISQNTDPDINDFVIRTQIAYNYMIIDEKAALEMFKEINFGGINDTILAFVYLQNGEINQALNYSTSGIINHLGELIGSTAYMILALSGKGGKTNIGEAVCIADTMIKVIDFFAKDEVGCFYKYKAFYHAIKAYLCVCMGDFKGMKKSISEGKKLAACFDEKSSNDMAKQLKFYHSDKKQYYMIDSIGENATLGIGAFFSKQLAKMAFIDKEALKMINDYWDKN
ncbi:helix-turn-helix domain-containing protein [Butyrivibrio hungatei]|uniref:helix-turn-helix domain-containing protein n=1 Tax=Butyrivibrio hungatei TaxID=185008 RepID=UPI00040E19B9|nr:helix-turn-helix transcriptional regulator [Butyrivibrio hungatei]